MRKKFLIGLAFLLALTFTVIGSDNARGGEGIFATEIANDEEKRIYSEDGKLIEIEYYTSEGILKAREFFAENINGLQRTTREIFYWSDGETLQCEFRYKFIGARVVIHERFIYNELGNLVSSDKRWDDSGYFKTSTIYSYNSKNELKQTITDYYDIYGKKIAD